MLQLPDLPCVSDYVSWYAERAPDLQAAWFDGQYATYAELEQRADRFARALLSLGLGKGDRVAVLCTPRTEFLVAWLGAIRVGCVYLGLNPRYTYRELAFVANDAQPAAVFSLAKFEQTDFEPLVARLRTEVPSIRHTFRLDAGPDAGVLRSGADFLAGARTVPDDRFIAAKRSVGTRDPAVIVYTSGSTGTPKGAVIPQESLVYGPCQQARIVGVEHPRTVCALPTNHIGCLADMSAGALCAGGLLAFMDRFEPGRMLDLVAGLRLTHLQHTPTVLQMLVQHPKWQTSDLSSLRVATWGGAALSIDTLRALRARGLKLLLGYGQTESISNVCWADDSYSDEDLTSTIGRADANQAVKLVDEHLIEVPDGVAGEILVRHHAQMLGYFNRPEATAAAFTADGFLRTGDVAVRRPDGVFQIVGRRSDMFKSGGYNVYPREIELCLEEHPSVGVAAVVGVPDPAYSEVGVAYLLAKPGAPRPDDAALRAWCKERLANYKVPKTFVFKDEMPLLPIGKVDKQALKREAREGPRAA